MSSQDRRSFQIRVFRREKGEPSIVLSVALRGADNVSILKRLVASAPQIDLPVERVALRTSFKGKFLTDELTTDQLLEQLNPSNNVQEQDTIDLFVKDLGPQIGWKTVFLAEYAGPVFVYAASFFMPRIFYGKGASGMHSREQTLLLLCWTTHYVKRILETIYVHRFSHGTMPIKNLFKNCSYYWGFAAFIGYFCNHPSYTPAGTTQLLVGLATFLLCEFGNFSIHWALMKLRPPGTKERKIPYPTGNPFTALFSYVSCPNYTYEVGSWIGFSLMASSLPAGIFAVVGFAQMAIWALGKHKAYRKEFPSYPKHRKAILPFLL